MSGLSGKLNFASISPGSSLPGVTRTISQEDINLYAEASGDFNPIHIDEAFAVRTPLGGTIAHGMLVLGYLSDMMTSAFGSAWLSGGKLSVRFKTLARPKDTLTIGGKVNSVTHEDGASRISCSVEVRNQRGEAVIIGEAAVKYCSEVHE